MCIEHMQLSGIFPFYGCVPLGWSRLGSVIQDHLEHGTCTCTCTCTSNEPLNPFPDCIYKFLWCTLIYHLNKCTSHVYF